MTNDRPTQTPTLDAGSLVLRALERGDTPALFPTFADPRQCLYMSRPHFEDEETLADWLTDPEWNGRTWVAIDKADGALVGRFVVVPGRDPGVVEVGYITVLGRQGRGVASTALRALIGHLFLAEGVRRVFAEIDAENLPSIALAERLGFVREGCLRQHEVSHRGLCDMVVYGLLRDEWASGTATAWPQPQHSNVADRDLCILAVTGYEQPSSED